MLPLLDTWRVRRVDVPASMPTQVATELVGAALNPGRTSRVTPGQRLGLSTTGARGRIDDHGLFRLMWRRPGRGSAWSRVLEGKMEEGADGPHFVGTFRCLLFTRVFMTIWWSLLLAAVVGMTTSLLFEAGAVPGAQFSSSLVGLVFTVAFSLVAGVFLHFAARASRRQEDSLLRWLAELLN